MTYFDAWLHIQNNHSFEVYLNYSLVWMRQPTLRKTITN